MDRKENPKPIWKIARRLAAWMENILALAGLLAVVYWCCFDYSYLVSDSMMPTLRWTPKSRDSVLTERISYWFRTPRRWEVITCRNAAGLQVMKRVIGLPGETVQMPADGQILIDGQQVYPPFGLEHLRYRPDGDLSAGKTFDCGDGYFVLGDHSIDSDDSRFLGVILPQDIIGRAWLIVQPGDRRGFVR